jgi:CheY-like chemotaxis protein
VEDSGLGIAPEQQGRLFVPFARLGAEQTGIEGTGLGLALSRRLVEAMGGTLELEASTPEGSTFRVELRPAGDPLGQAAAEARHMDPVQAEPSPTATLLYVEDNLANLNLVEMLLARRPGWRLIPALQGGLGVELAREHAPDVILLDLHLPDVSGEEVLRQLRADPRTAAIPVIVISADATPRTMERLQAAGADEYLTKPLNIKRFVEAVNAQLAEAPRP